MGVFVYKHRLKADFDCYTVACTYSVRNVKWSLDQEMACRNRLTKCFKNRQQMTIYNVLGKIIKNNNKLKGRSL